MRMIKHKLRIALFAGFASMATYSQAWDVVIDPTNLVQNYMTAISTVKSEITTSKAYVEQAKAAMQLARSTSSLNGLNSLAAVTDEYNMYSKWRDNNIQLESILNKGIDETRQAITEVGAGDKSWDTFLKSSDARDKVKAASYLNEYQMINASLTSTANKRKNILNELQGATGQTAATQAVGAQIDVLIGQQQQMMSQLSASKMQESKEMDQAKVNEELGRKVREQRQQAMRDASAKFIVPIKN